MRTIKTMFRSGKSVIIIIPVIFIVILALGAGTNTGYRMLKQYKADRIAEAERLQEEQRQIEESVREEQMEMRREAELEAMRVILDSDRFFQGLYLDDVDLSQMTLMEAVDYFSAAESAYRETFQIKVVFDEQELLIDHESADLTANWLDLLEKIWLFGRENRLDSDALILEEQYERVIGFQDDPLYFYSEYFYDEKKIEKQILAFAEEWSYDPVGATATAFDMREKRFIITERIPGLRVDGEKAAAQVLRLLEENNFGQVVTAYDEVIYTGYDAATILARTGFVSESKTYAEAVNPGRDENIRLVANILNGTVLQPGETFSFNDFVGRRTADRGFREAGVIVGGVLVDQLGGGICQPNTTLFQAAAKAGLEIITRYAHSWPSSYTKVGLDATVSWGGPDFRFRNNTDYPVAIMSWYTKPDVVFQIYGQLFDEGVTIKLEVDHHGYIPIPDPETKETYNPKLQPGERIELRKPYVGQKTTAYRVWEKGGSTIKREAIAVSYYAPLQGLVEYGPEIPLEPDRVEPVIEQPDIVDLEDDLPEN